MSELPKVTPEELYKSLYEKASDESKELSVQVATMEILASKLRNERDTTKSKLDEALEIIAQRGDSEGTETIEGEVL